MTQSAGPAILIASINGVRLGEVPNTPAAPAEIAADALACLAAGAAVIHNHIDLVRVPGDIAAGRYKAGGRCCGGGRTPCSIPP